MKINIFFDLYENTATHKIILTNVKNKVDNLDPYDKKQAALFLKTRKK